MYKKALFELMPNETVLYEHPGIVLTTHRLREYSQRHLKSLLLTEINSCSMEFIDKPIYVLLSIVFGLTGMFMGSRTHNDNFAIAGIMLAALFLLGYFVSRQGAVVIAAQTLTITIPYNAHSRATMIELIDQIEEATHYAQQVHVETQAPPAPVHPYTLARPASVYEPELG